MSQRRAGTASASSAVLLDEPIHDWKLLAGVLVIAGLRVNHFGRKFQSRLQLAAERK